MKGASAEPCVNTNKSPNNVNTNTNGNIQNFLRSIIKANKSFTVFSLLMENN